MPNGYELDPDAIASVGKEFDSLSRSLQRATEHAKPGGFSSANFGTVPSGEEAGAQLIAIVEQLATSIGYVSTSTAEMVGQLKAVVTSYQQSDEQAQQTVSASGQGL